MNEMDKIEMLARMWIECDPNRGGTDPDAPIATDGGSSLDGKPQWAWFVPRAEAAIKYIEERGYRLEKVNGEGN